MSESAILLLSLASIGVLGISAQWIAWRLRIPSILLLLLFGFLVGPGAEMLSENGERLLQPDELFGNLLFPVVSLSVAVILFEGSLSLRLSDLNKISTALRNLLTIGVVVTWVLVTLGAKLLLGFDFASSLLLGALLVVTGPTVVTPLLLFLRPTGRVGPIAKWEGIIIDPIGAVLAVLVFEGIHAFHAAEEAGATMAATSAAGLGLLITLVVGVGLGAGSAWLLSQLLRRHWIPDHLQNPVTLMLVLLVFTASNLLQEESGLLTVTLMGVLMANTSEFTIKHILKFKEDLTVLLVSCLFIVLTARLSVDDFRAIGLRGVGFVAFVILIVRPIAVVLSSWKAELKREEIIFLSWLAPRGIVAAAVASVFALHAEHAGLHLPSGFVAATFFVIAGTVITYGLTIGPVAKKLGLATPNPQGVIIAGANPFAREVALVLQQLKIPVQIVGSNYLNLKQARMQNIPTTYVDILTEHAMERLNFGGMGRFLAMTPNDGTNSLATIEFSEIFGRTEVYQLTDEKSNEDERQEAPAHLRGRLLFASHATYRQLDKRISEGAVIKATPLTKEFTFEDLQNHYQESFLALFVVNDDGQLIVNTTASTLSPKAGHTVIALVDPVETAEDDDEEE